ncbi:MAG: HEPN domain-containing protein [Magnetococcus sp. DMHC-1]
MKPSEFLKHAEKIFEMKGDEAAMRSACSRAYYAAYHSCRILMRYIDAKPYNTETGEHQKLISHFTNCISLSEPMNTRDNVKSIKKIGHMLGDCRNLRHDADYHLESVFLEVNAESVIVNAQNIINKIKELNSSR